MTISMEMQIGYTTLNQSKTLEHQHTFNDEFVTFCDAGWFGYLVPIHDCAFG
jgi:hypothetical protein